MTEAKLDHFYLFYTKVKKALDGYKVKWGFQKGIAGKRSIPWVVKKLTEFYACHRSSHFTELDFQIYFLESIIKNEKFLENCNIWNPRDVKKVSRIEMTEMIVKDQEFILKVSKSSGVKDPQIFFDINNNGESLISSFYEKGLISIHFLVKYCMYFIESENETEKHKKIVKISKIIREILQNYKEN